MLYIVCLIKRHRYYEAVVFKLVVHAQIMTGENFFQNPTSIVCFLMVFYRVVFKDFLRTGKKKLTVLPKTAQKVLVTLLRCFGCVLSISCKTKLVAFV